MRIASIEVTNFKSLVDFKLDLAKFNCLIGLNGSGKSTVLQFLDFVSQLVRGDMKAWLSERKWKSSELKSKLTKKVNIDFQVRFSDNDGKPAGRWEGVYSPSKNRCTRERIDLLDFLLEADTDKVDIHDLNGASGNSYRVTFDYEGSVLSSLKEDLLPPSILQCKRLFQKVTSLDLLSPEHLRQRTRESSGALGRGGQNLSAFLHEMDDVRRRELIADLKQAYPRLQGLRARSLRSGWKQIEISETYAGHESGSLPRMITEARHVNDGMLRLMAILAEMETDSRFLLFDEIENGINPELVEFVIGRLVGTAQQVLVTTHSPMILNYLDDDTARAGVIYVYKTTRGHTKSVPFFSIPSLAKKLTVMGPGEAFVDTDLTQLAVEIAEMAGEEA
ncbi:MAG: AAA family ATPase [Patescibacteria group bacterium]|nr:AAA family ATPase [Patescibacteria group bacterium]